MKWVIAVFVLLGVAAGLLTDGSASGRQKVEFGFAAVLVCHIVFAIWVWHRAKPGSSDTAIAPTFMLLSTSALIRILPRLLWPAAGRLHIAALIVSAVLLVIVLIIQVRRHRGLRQSGPAL